MDNFYRENILDHYKNPRNFGHLENPDISNTLGNPLCGDNLGVEIKWSENKKPKNIKKLDKSDIIGNVRFFGVGCAVSVASASMLTEKIRGMQIEDILKMGIEDIENMLSIKLTASRIKCAILSLELLQKSLRKSL